MKMRRAIIIIIYIYIYTLFDNVTNHTMSSYIFGVAPCPASRINSFLLVTHNEFTMHLVWSLPSMLMLWLLEHLMHLLLA